MKNKFEGFYFKQQKEGQTLSLIPGRSLEEAFIQVITNEGSFNASYPLTQYKYQGVMQVGTSRFGVNGIKIHIKEKDFTLEGQLKYTNHTPIKGDIMGPFRFFPMECRHTVRSMHHDVTGKLLLNGRSLDFTGGNGYIEGDSGRSFPTSYSWVQCNKWDNKEFPCSVMASVARIPFAGFQFWGCIAIVWYQGKEYRLATYRGVKIKKRTPNKLELIQRGLRLTIEIPEHKGHSLLAPNKGRMGRTIHESPDLPAHFIFEKDGSIVFDQWSQNASYEYVK